NLSYSKQATGRTNVTQAINISGDLSLSEKWKINFTSGFDLSAKQATQTMIGIARDLHCWQLNVNWVPFGRLTSYSIDIRVTSSILKDLEVTRRRSVFDPCQINSLMKPVFALWECPCSNNKNSLLRLWPSLYNRRKASLQLTELFHTTGGYEWRRTKKPARS